MPSLQQATARGLGYLRTAQQGDGSFISHSSPAIRPFQARQTYRTTFTPSLVLHSLSDIEAARDIRTPLAAWLVGQRSQYGSYNYWAKDAPETTTLPYPDDLDDTFCALSALHRHDPELVDAATLGQAVNLLIAAEEQVGGPYRTWLAAPDAAAVWRDVDLAVNSNIAYFLRLVAEPLPSLTRLMEQAITTKAYRSPYYASAWPLLYYLSRAYRGPHAAVLTQHIQKQAAHTPLQVALRISALRHLGYRGSLESSVQYLLQSQQADGSWPAAAFCIDPSRGGKPYYNGHPALTTALCLEALQRYQDRPQAPAVRQPKFGQAYQQVTRTAQQLASGLDQTLRTSFEASLRRMVAGDTSREIVGLPQLFAASLQQPADIPPAIMDQLGLANVCGWMAYTIYDDLLDGQGSTALLPVASTALRASVTAFQRAVPDPAFCRLVAQTFDTIDAANAWETAHCRGTLTATHITFTAMPRYGGLDRLAERSLGHTLTPLGVLTAAGYALQSPVVQHVQQALRHYLIARQLQDDMHDWEADLRAGQLNAVAVAILRDMRRGPGSYAFQALLPGMQRCFWQRSLPAACQRVEHHLTIARQALAASNLIRSNAPLLQLFDRLETAMATTRREQTKALEFLAAYQKPAG